MITFKAFVIFMFLFTSEAYAAWKDTHNVKIKLISVWAPNGGILIQTEPLPKIEGLSCTSDYWLSLGKDRGGYDALLSVLLTAQAGGKSVTVRASEGEEDFCRLERVIITN